MQRNCEPVKLEVGYQGETYDSLSVQLDFQKDFVRWDQSKALIKRLWWEILFFRYWLQAGLAVELS